MAVNIAEHGKETGVSQHESAKGAQTGQKKAKNRENSRSRRKKDIRLRRYLFSDRSAAPEARQHSAWGPGPKTSGLALNTQPQRGDSKVVGSNSLPAGTSPHYPFVVSEKLH